MTKLTTTPIDVKKADTSAPMETSLTNKPTQDAARDTTTIDQKILEEFTARLRSRVAVCEAVTGYSFRDRHLCAEALNRLDGDAALVLKDGESVCLPKNDKLAVYGDVVATAELYRVWVKKPGSFTGRCRFLSPMAVV